MLNDSIRYHDGALCVDSVPAAEIAAACGTPVYVYSLPRLLKNYRRILDAFAPLDARIFYSAKANGNLVVLRALVDAGAGIDAVSGGEIFKALYAGCPPERIVFAGAGKSPDELRYAVQQGIGWINVENVEECGLINDFAAGPGRSPVQIALRLNPEIAAATHPYIATGHGGAKFGMTADTIASLLATQAAYPNLRFSGIHVHIGSQLHDTGATRRAVQVALDLIAPYPDIRTLNIGGGLPVVYRPENTMPDYDSFATALAPLLDGYRVLLEPGRAVVADAGILATRVLYVKRQAGQTFIVVDAGMSELIRPALYQAYHHIVPLDPSHAAPERVHIVGPVCETADVLGSEVDLPPVRPGDLLAVLTVGAYGMVMANNYNARPRPPEVVVVPDGRSWRVARPRETWNDLVRGE